MSKGRASSRSPRPTTFSNSSSPQNVLLALRSSPPSFGIAEGERIARDLYGLAVSIKALPGERDCNFRLRTADARGAQARGAQAQGGHPAGASNREFVLKVLHTAADAESIDCLVKVLDHL